MGRNVGNRGVLYLAVRVLACPPRPPAHLLVPRRVEEIAPDVPADRKAKAVSSASGENKPPKALPLPRRHSGNKQPRPCLGPGGSGNTRAEALVVRRPEEHPPGRQVHPGCQGRGRRQDVQHAWPSARLSECGHPHHTLKRLLKGEGVSAGWQSRRQLSTPSRKPSSTRSRSAQCKTQCETLVNGQCERVQRGVKVQGKQSLVTQKST